MIGERTKALLSAAATIYGGCWANPSPGGIDKAQCVADAYALLAAIEQREKAQYGTRSDTDPVPCGTCGDEGGHYPFCHANGGAP